MKTLLLIMLTTFSFAGTKYRTPVFVVENSTLYCFYSLTSKIEEYKPGDLVDGDYASHYCSYNKETMKTKHKEHIEMQEKQDRKDNIVFLILSLFSVIVLWLMFSPNNSNQKEKI